MSDRATERLATMLRASEPRIEALAHLTLDRVDRELPGAHRMVYDNYNATVVGCSPDGKARHAVCSLAAYPRRVNLFVFAGPDVEDPHHLLRGSGSTVRSVRLTEPTDLDGRVVDILRSVVSGWAWPFDPDRPLDTVIVSGSEKRRARRPRQKRR